MSINLAPANDFRQIGSIHGNESVGNSLAIMAGWYATDTTTIASGGTVNLVTEYADKGLYCRQLEDANHTGKYISYREHWQSASDTTRYFNPGTGAWKSGTLPIVSQVLYDGTGCATVTMYFNKFTPNDGRAVA